MMTLATRRPLEQPVEGDLRHGLAGLPGDLVEGVDDPVDVLVGDRRPDVGHELALEPAGLRQRLAAADLAGEPAPAERAPDDRADLLVEGQRHQLPLVVAADQRVIGLVGDVARQAVLAPRRPATSSGASRRSSSSRCSGSCRPAPGRRACPALPRPASARRSRAAGRGRCSRCPAAAGSPRPPGSGGSATSPRRSGPGPMRKVPLVEMSTWSRRPLIAWPRISSAIPFE